MSKVVLDLRGYLSVADQVVESRLWLPKDAPITGSPRWSQLKRMYVAEALVKILYGAEHGFSPMVSMTGVFTVNGRPSLGAPLVAALLRRNGYNWTVVVADTQQCEIEFKSEVKGFAPKTLGTIRVTLEEAKSNKWHLSPRGVPSDAWTKHSDDMLFWTVMRKGAKRFASEVLAGEPFDTNTAIEADVVEEAPAIETAVVEEQPKQISTEARAKLADVLPVPSAESEHVVVADSSGKTLTVDAKTGEVLAEAESKPTQSSFDQIMNEPPKKSESPVADALEIKPGSHDLAPDLFPAEVIEAIKRGGDAMSAFPRALAQDLHTAGVKAVGRDVMLKVWQDVGHDIRTKAPLTYGRACKAVSLLNGLAATATS